MFRVAFEDLEESEVYGDRSDVTVNGRTGLASGLSHPLNGSNGAWM